MKRKHLEFWLTWNHHAEMMLRLPVLLPKLTVKSGHEYNDIEMADLGEVTIIGEPTLKEYSFSTVWPEQYDPGICDYAGFPSPEQFIATLERWEKLGVSDPIHGNRQQDQHASHNPGLFVRLGRVRCGIQPDVEGVQVRQYPE